MSNCTIATVVAPTTFTTRQTIAVLANETDADANEAAEQCASVVGWGQVVVFTKDGDYDGPHAQWAFRAAGRPWMMGGPNGVHDANAITAKWTS